MKNNYINIYLDLSAYNKHLEESNKEYIYYAIS